MGIRQCARTLLHFLFDYRPEYHLEPTQAKVSLIAMYTIGLAGMIAAPFNAVYDYRQGPGLIFLTHAIFLALLITGIIVFWMTRYLRVFRLIYVGAMISLVTGIAFSGAGSSGTGFFISLPDMAYCIMCLGYEAGLSFPCWCWAPQF